MSEKAMEKKTFLDKFMDVVETACNKLPPPAILFCYLFMIVGILGAVFSTMGVQLVNPATGDVVTSKNLFSTEGLHWFLNNMVKNFTGFGPLGLVLTMTVGTGICEESGLFVTMLRSAMKNVPGMFVPYVVVFLGIVGNLASDAASVMIPPLAALAYIGVGKNPIAGMICGYMGAQVGYASNPIISGTDTLLMGFTNDALTAFIPESGFLVDATCNWFIKIGSTILCTIVVAVLCEKMVAPRFGKYEGEVEELEDITPQQKKGLRTAGLATLIYAILLVVLFLTGPLAGENGAFIGSPFLKGLIPIIFLLFAIAGISYGYSAGTFKSTSDINKSMTKQMSAMGSYVLFCFFCGQFQGLFNWTQIGTLSAIAGADFLKAVGFTGIPMCVAFIILTTLVDIFFSSGSAKWAIFGPIFVPMFMLLGYHPAFAQYVYRMGDSAGNLFGPTSAYLWMLLSLGQSKYDKNLKIGQIISCNLSVALVLEVIWIGMLVVWMLAGLPLGPGVGIHMPAGVI